MSGIASEDRRKDVERRKGGTVSMWIWIIGGLAAAILTFAAAYTNITQVGLQTSKQNVIDQFNSMNQDIDSLCLQAAGARKSMTAKLRNVRAIYASNRKSEPDSKAPKLIADSQRAVGNYTCLTFINGHYGCVETECKVNMTWIGRPLPGSDMYSLGAGDGTFDFRLDMAKTTEESVVIKAEHLP
ncbi:MAG: hypothetical protein SVV03_05415 [Candidatus Nanohaloarchaea archaeon]|nr:hypothetical protein [Candidatus Nanohaloarchaea archaeon]